MFYRLTISPTTFTPQFIYANNNILILLFIIIIITIIIIIIGNLCKTAGKWIPG